MIHTRSLVRNLAKVSSFIQSLTERPKHHQPFSSPSTHKSPQAKSPATSPVPATGAIKPVAALEPGDASTPPPLLVLVALAADSLRLPIS